MGKRRALEGKTFHLFPHPIFSLARDYIWSLRMMSIVTGISRYTSEAIMFLVHWIVYFLIRNMQ